MAKERFHATAGNGAGKGFSKESCRPSKITAFTPYGTCNERITPFGELLGMIKFLDLLGFKEVFDHLYRGPGRDPSWVITRW